MKAIKTSVIAILAIGLLAGAAVGVAAQETDDPGTAAYVNGFMVGDGDCCGNEVQTFDDDDNRLTLRGMVASGSMEMDDPRLNGVYEVTVKLDEFPQLDTDERVEVSWGELTITNDEGPWSGSGTWTSTYDSAASEETELTQYELTGAGEYEGLSALLSPTGSGADWPRMPMSKTTLGLGPDARPGVDSCVKGGGR